jgi:hypothetical protein
LFLVVGLDEGVAQRRHSICHRVRAAQQLEQQLSVELLEEKSRLAFLPAGGPVLQWVEAGGSRHGTQGENHISIIR